jgi:hypothetical protein
MSMNITTESLGSNSCAHIPEEHAAVTASRHKPLIISRNGKTQDFIAMCRVCLDETTLRDAVAIFPRDRCTGEWVVEADGSVR